MKKETLRQILDMAKDEKTAAEVLEMIKNYEEKYEDGTDGTTVKLKIFKAPDGTVVTEICSLFEYRDISKMSLEELRGYYEELSTTSLKVRNPRMIHPSMKNGRTTSLKLKTKWMTSRNELLNYPINAKKFNHRSIFS